MNTNGISFRRVRVLEVVSKKAFLKPLLLKSGARSARPNEPKGIRAAIVVLFLLVLGQVSGCALVKARPAKDAGFITHPELLAERPERAPFNGYWVKDAAAYDELRFGKGKIFIAPIDVSYALTAYKNSWGPDWIKVDRMEEVEELARYFREHLRLELNSMTNGRLQVVDDPSPDALTLRLALVEVVPTNPGVNLLGTAAGVFVPGGGAIKFLGEGSVAMEGFVEQGLASENPAPPEPHASEMPSLESVVWEAYKDREGQKVSAFTIKDYQQYAHIRVVLDEWSEQISQLLTTDGTVRVEGRYLVSLNPF